MPGLGKYSVHSFSPQSGSAQPPLAGVPPTAQRDVARAPDSAALGLRQTRRRPLARLSDQRLSEGRGGSPASAGVAAASAARAAAQSGGCCWPRWAPAGGQWHLPPSRASALAGQRLLGAWQPVQGPGHLPGFPWMWRGEGGRGERGRAQSPRGSAAHCC